MSYASSVVDRYRAKSVRMRRVVESLFFGKLRGSPARRAETMVGGGLRLSPLAETLLRGYSGVYALEETTEELSGKVLGFIRLEEKRDKDFVRSLLGLKAAPHFKRMILSIILNLFFKLPLCVLLTIMTIMLAERLNVLYPGVVEVESPGFVVVVFVLIAILFY